MDSFRANDDPGVRREVAEFSEMAFGLHHRCAMLKTAPLVVEVPETKGV